MDIYSAIRDPCSPPGETPITVPRSADTGEAGYFRQNLRREM